jgi:hypothetical protein
MYFVKLDTSYSTALLPTRYISIGFTSKGYASTKLKKLKSSGCSVQYRKMEHRHAQKQNAKRTKKVLLHHALLINLLFCEKCNFLA